jgi:hypothetical protein
MLLLFATGDLYIQAAPTTIKDTETMSKVWILILDHHNGRDVYAASSFHVAYDRLDEYVMEWWSSTRGSIASERMDPPPGDPASMTPEAFFDYHAEQGKRIEQWELNEYDVLT